MENTRKFNIEAVPFVPSTATNKAKQIPLTCTGHTRPVVDLCFSGLVSNNQYFLISACKDSIPILRNGINGDYIGSFDGHGAHKGAVWSAKLSHDASLSVTASADFTVRLWSNNQGQLLLTFPHNHVVKVVDITRDNRYIISGGFEKKIRIFDLANPEPTTPFRVLNQENPVNCCVMDSQRGMVFSGDGKKMKIWDLREEEPVGIREFDAEIKSISFSFLNYVIVCCGKSVYFYSLDTLELVKEFPCNVEVSSASQHPSGDRFVIGGTTDLWLRVYDWETAKEIEVHKGHHGPVHCVSYSPDGNLYASASEDGTVRLWQTFVGSAYGNWPAQS